MSTPQFPTAPVASPVAAARGFVADVFAWMFVGLAITAGLAAYFASQNDMVKYVQDNPMAIWIVIIAQLGLVVFLVAGMNKMTANTARLVFCLYAATLGFTFALIFEMYTTASIATTFVSTAGMFGGAALFGYVTKRDLTMVGQVCMMLIIGVFLALIVNIFVGSSTVDLVISVVGVVVFTALTAYDLQKIKQIAAQAGQDEEATRKAAIFGALALYLDFVNIFLFLLRFTGAAR